jgi:hypothetical protein
MQKSKEIKGGPPKKKSNKGKKIAPPNFDSIMHEVHLKKPWHPNWEHKEVVALIQAKKEKHTTRLNKMDPRDKFVETFVTKWKKILEVVMSVGSCYHLWNGSACKNKWASILGDFKKFFYMSRIGHNEDYWALSPQENASCTSPLWLWHQY